MKHVVVVGAGLAGLTTAVRLADAGIRVTVLERLPVPGGRVRAVRGPHGTPLDWGQHLLLGAYRATRRLAERLGSTRRLKTIDSPTPLVTASGTRHAYGVARLPAPFHALPALIGLTHLSVLERLALGLPVLAAKLESRVAPARLDRRSAREWLVANGQTEQAIRGFWEPLIVATCNAEPGEASAALLAAVIDKGFFAEREDAIPLLPETTLHDALVGPSVEALADRGGALRTGEEVVGLDTNHRGRLVAVRTARGEVLAADGAVLAVPAWRVGRLLPETPAFRPLAEDAAWLGSSAIACVEAWFDRAWLDVPFAGLVGGTVQWVFAHDGGEVPDGAQRVSMVVSRAASWIERKRDELFDAALEDVHRYFPASRAARITARLVVREPNATFLGRPGQAARRPPTRTAIPNLALAGDWVATGLPATIEGAVRSGEAAAQLLIETDALSCRAKTNKPTSLWLQSH